MTLAEYVATRPRRSSAPGKTVLIFDQFEEILTMDPAAIDAKREFFAQLGQLLQNPHVWAIFALREDYLAQLDPYAHLVPTNLKNRFRLDLMGRDAAEEAIENWWNWRDGRLRRKRCGNRLADLAKMQVQQPDGEFRARPDPILSRCICRWRAWSCGSGCPRRKP